MHLVLASIIQRFDLQLADPSSYSCASPLFIPYAIAY
jgi:hypothetical protein